MSTRYSRITKAGALAAAAVVGGAGTVTGPFIAALLVGIVDVAGKYYLPEAGAFLIYVVMIVMLLVRPNGIVPRKGIAA